MRHALVRDLLDWIGRSKAADHRPGSRTGVVSFHDTRLPDAWMSNCKEDKDDLVQWVMVRSREEEIGQLAAWARRVDQVVLIAPESGGVLESRCRLVQQQGGTLLSPDAEFVAWASDKHRTASWLAARGVPVPDGTLLAPNAALPRRFSYPAVLKPVDGCAGLETARVQGPTDRRPSPVHSGTRWRLESFCPGMPVSVAALCGPAQHLLLAPCEQRTRPAGGFRYLGGRLPLSSACSARVDELARQTLAAMPPTRGYVGIDMILGPDATGRQDVVLEVNPRLTTSYVGLRRATSTNLAALMIDVALGHPFDAPLWCGDSMIEFDVDGTVTICRRDPS